MTLSLSASKMTRLAKLLPRSWRRPAGILLLVIACILAGLTWQSGSGGQSTDYTANQVVKVIDGDTIDVFVDGQVARVRLIGIDTPETVDPRKPVQCFGQQASNATKQLLEGQTVTLVTDPTQDDVDKYHRLLRYVYLADGTMVNQYLVAHGFAFEYTYRIPYQFQSQFKQAEAKAQQNNSGLWNPHTCDGHR